MYEEREDEFDVVVDELGEGKDGKDSSQSPEDEDVDIVTIRHVPAFDSDDDSEDERDIFYFDSKVDRILSEKEKHSPKKAEE